MIIYSVFSNKLKLKTNLNYPGHIQVMADKEIVIKMVANLCSWPFSKNWFVSTHGWRKLEKILQESLEKNLKVSDYDMIGKVRTV